MYSTSMEFRVKYGETDRMGYAYYGNYAQYFEVARVEALRELGFTYKQLEDDGILLPVRHYNVDYLKPAYYDDVITVKTYIKESPSARITFEYEVFNADDEVITNATVVLVFIDAASGRPCRPPKEMCEAIETHLK